jgi:hypothetical protein
LQKALIQLALILLFGASINLKGSGFPSVDEIQRIDVWYYKGSIWSARYPPDYYREERTPAISATRVGGDDAIFRLYQVLQLGSFIEAENPEPTSENIYFMVDLHLADGSRVSFSEAREGSFVTVDGAWVYHGVEDVIDQLKQLIPVKKKGQYLRDRSKEESHPTYFHASPASIEVFWVPNGFTIEDLQMVVKERWQLRFLFLNERLFSPNYLHWLDVNQFQIATSPPLRENIKFVIRFQYRRGPDQFLISQDLKRFFTADGHYQIDYPEETTRFWQGLVMGE